MSKGVFKMSLWNVFRMEMFKNLHDRTNIFVIIVLMCVNIIGGLVVSDLVINNTWMWSVNMSAFQEAVLLVLVFSVIASAAFMFIYPYQLSRVDYKNNVMSLMIASGVSRVQYYFVKIGATLIFSFASFLLVVFIPLVIATRGVALTGLTLLDIEFDLSFGLFLIAWLSMFFMLMTAVIIVKGKWVAIFVYFGLSIATSIVFNILQGILGIDWWDRAAMNTFSIFQYLSTIVVFAVIGILVLRKQDL